MWEFTLTLQLWNKIFGVHYTSMWKIKQWRNLRHGRPTSEYSAVWCVIISGSLLAMSGRRKTPWCQLRLPLGEDRGQTAVTEQMEQLAGLGKWWSWPTHWFELPEDGENKLIKLNQSSIFFPFEAFQYLLPHLFSNGNGSHTECYNGLSLGYQVGYNTSCPARSPLTN